MPRRRTPEEMVRELMRKYASLGGKARIAKLTQEERRALARKAGKASGAARRNKKKKAKGKVVKFTARRREAMDLVKFIDARGGRLGAFRGYGAAQAAQQFKPRTDERV